MPHYFRVKHMKKSSQPGPSHKCRKAKYCSLPGSPPHEFTVGWQRNKKGEIVHVGVDADGKTNPLPPE